MKLFISTFKTLKFHLQYFFAIEINAKNYLEFFLLYKGEIDNVITLFLAFILWVKRSNRERIDLKYTRVYTK